MRHARIAVAAGIILALSAPSVAVANVPPASAALIEKVNEIRRSSGLPTLPPGLGGQHRWSRRRAAGAVRG